MSPEHVEWVWLDASVCVTLSELSDCCGLSLAELQELVDYSALVPTLPTLPTSPRLLQARLPPTQLFSAGWVPPLRAASKMRQDFDLDLFSVAVLLSMLNRIEALEREVRALQTHVSADTVL